MVINKFLKRRYCFSTCMLQHDRVMYLTNNWWIVVCRDRIPRGWYATWCIIYPVSNFQTFNGWQALSNLPSVSHEVLVQPQSRDSITIRAWRTATGLMTAWISQLHNTLTYYRPSTAATAAHSLPTWQNALTPSGDGLGDGRLSI